MHGETSKFDAVAAPAEPGYTVTNPDAAPAMDITSDTKSSTVTFIYKANEHSVTITYVDNNGKKVDSYTETGTTGETVNPEVNAHVPEGYHITDKTVPGPITFGSNDPAPITVHVEKNVNPTDADKYTPEPKDIKTQVGKEPTPEQGIGNIPNLPSGTTYTWTNGAPDVTTPGTKSTEITVHYPDGTTDTVTTKVIVEEPTKNPTDADKYTPEPKDIKTQVGKEPTPEQGIGNIPNLPSGTTYTWTNGAPDVTTPGTKSVEITVHYPDGTTDTVTTKVIVEEPTKNPSDADKYTPEPKDIKTQVGKEPTPEQGIANIPNLPSGTTYTWTNGAPDVTTPGTKSVEITVHYPDGTTDTVTTKVVVEEPTNPTPQPTPTDSDIYTPEPKQINTQVGVTPSPEDGIGNIPNLPSGTTYTWTNGAPDVTTPGTKSVEITVHYPDGTTDTVTTTVVVSQPEKTHDKTPSDKTTITPVPKPVVVPSGKVPTAEQGIKNKGDFPSGTKFTWKDTPDTSKPGKITGTVIVTYPNGETTEVPVEITVAPHASGADFDDEAGTHSLNNDENAGIHATRFGANARVHSSFYQDGKKAKTLPQTGAQENNTAGVLGLVIASVGAILGLAVNKKRKN
ncbi:Rib/alpha-like domain-containing protein [Lactobacillus sp. PV034]|uniref:Rib/alpha-like domain-containing protein n=1 Tax=Lactobacillus sp. PV034 TaxID=2594495 RepID=UPI00223F11FE|nr:Rib/alpha-like domain-containing protein [Lactobacillus sp. PV034]QNQ81094.1 LPXTG cell wall anchor domain-containing protein [Lactobacillus sp. PV034]